MVTKVLEFNFLLLSNLQCALLHEHHFFNKHLFLQRFSFRCKIWQMFLFIFIMNIRLYKYVKICPWYKINAKNDLKTMQRLTCCNDHL